MSTNTPVKGEVQTPTPEELRTAHIYASAGSAYPGDQENAGKLARCVLRLADVNAQLVEDRKMLMDGMSNALNIIAQGPQLKAIQCPNCTGTPIPGSVLAGFTINDRQEAGMCRCHNCGHRWQSITEDGRITELKFLLASLKSRP